MENIGVSLNWLSTTTHDFPTLSQHDLHLWWLPLTLTDEQAEHALRLLSDIQRDKYHRRMTPLLKQAYLAGRYYLLTLLGLYNRCPAHKVELSYSRLNKPSLSHQGSHLEFNFTDTQHNNEHFGLFGFTRAGVIGVDIESRHRNIDLTQLIAKRFTPAERDYVTQADGRINKARGLSIWTRKEAYGKATGQGINFKMNQQNLTNQQHSKHCSDAAFNFRDSQTHQWRCLSLNLGQHFVASCVHSGNQALTISAFNSLKHGTPVSMMFEDK